ncbi:C10 family peptidase [Cronobacter muytjensii]|nr:C10 family peptidase [Cronobacter muytjensii]
MAKNLKIKTVPSLMTTKWSQEYPYTDEGIKEGYIPNRESLVGCTAIAGSQVLKFHQWPKQAKGVLPSYNLYPEKDIDGFEYQWELMPDRLTTESSQSEITATSTLTLDAGLAAKSAFSLSTAGSITDMVSTFITNFGYDKNVCIVNVDKNSFDVDSAEIQHHLRKSIDNRMPVLIDIPRHAIVCDGYHENGDFYFNYGWGEELARRLSFDIINAQKLHFGIRPAESESLTAEKVLCDFNNLSPGDTGTVSISLINLSEKAYNGKVKAVLVDSTGLTRSTLSEDLPLSIESQQELGINIPVIFNEGLKFGDRHVRILYEAESGIFRPVRNNHDDIIQHIVKTERKVQNGLTLDGDISLPKEIESGDTFSVEFTLSSEISDLVNLCVFSVDNKLNFGKELGSQALVVDSGNTYKVVIDCDSTLLISDHVCSIGLAIRKNSSDEWGYYSMIADAKGNVQTPTIFCKNPSVVYGEDVLQLENLDLSKKLFTEEKLHGTLQFSVASAIEKEKMLFLRLSLTDANNSIHASETINVKLDGSQEYSKSFSLALPDVRQDTTFNLNAEYMRVSENDTYYYLSPGKEDVVNPVKITVFYRNYYDYICLDSDLKLDKVDLQVGDKFKVSANMITNIDSEHVGGFICTLQVIMRDHNAQEYNVGEYINAAISRDYVLNYEIDCTVPELIQGNYEVFLRAKDVTTANGSPNDKVRGVEESVIDTVEVKVN